MSLHVHSWSRSTCSIRVLLTMEADRWLTPLKIRMQMQHLWIMRFYSAEYLIDESGSGLFQWSVVEITAGCAVHHRNHKGSHSFGGDVAALLVSLFILLCSWKHIKVKVAWDDLENSLKRQSNDVHVRPTGTSTLASGVCVCVDNSEQRQLELTPVVTGNVWMDDLMYRKWIHCEIICHENFGQ